MQILLYTWIAVTAVTACLLLYRASLTRYEEDQLFLNDTTMTAEHERQNLLQHRIAQIQPYVCIAGGLACAMFAFLIGSLTWQAWQTIR